MKTRATRLAVILVLGLFASCTLALAQDNTEPLHSFGCSSTQAESTFSADLNHLSNIQLVPVTDSKLIQQAQAGAVPLSTARSMQANTRSAASISTYIRIARKNRRSRSPILRSRSTSGSLCQNRFYGGGSSNWRNHLQATACWRRICPAPTTTPRRRRLRSCRPPATAPSRSLIYGG